MVYTFAGVPVVDTEGAVQSRLDAIPGQEKKSLPHNGDTSLHSDKSPPHNGETHLHKKFGTRYEAISQTVFSLLKGKNGYLRISCARRFLVSVRTISYRLRKLP